MDISIFITRLESLVRTLKDAPDKTLIHFSMGEPVDIGLVENIRHKYFQGIQNVAILDFYKKINGFQLIWEFSSVPIPEVDFHPLIFHKRNLKFSGVINFLPLEFAFNAAQWKDVIWFEDDSKKQIEFMGQISSNDEFKQRLIPFDFFSIDMSMALTHVGESDYLLLLQDYHIDYTNSLITYFDDYLDFIIETEGLVKARYSAFNVLNGYKKPLVNKTELIRKLNK